MSRPARTSTLMYARGVRQAEDWCRREHHAKPDRLVTSMFDPSVLHMFYDEVIIVEPISSDLRELAMFRSSHPDATPARVVTAPLPRRVNA